MKTSLALLVVFLAASRGLAVPPPIGGISTTLSPGGVVDLNQIITVRVTMGTYSGPESDSFNFVVNYDPGVLAFVTNSISLGTSSGPDQQWLTKPPQETSASGHYVTNANNATVPGHIFVAVGDVGNGYPRRGTAASAGFLISFQLRAIGPGVSPISISPTLNGSVVLNTSLQSAGTVAFNSTAITVRNSAAVTVTASDATASESGTDPGSFLITRTGSTNQPLTVYFAISGTAAFGADYVSAPSPIIIPAGSSNTTLVVTVVDDSELELQETAILTLLSYGEYDIGSPYSATVSIQDNENIPPTATLTGPANGSVFSAPTNLTLSATASDADGSVATVEFFSNGTTKIGEDTSSPYSIIWTNATPGPQVLTARTTDNFGSSGDSAPISIVIRGAPSVVITSPVNGATFHPPVSIPINVTAIDADGLVTIIDVLQNGIPLAATNSATLAYNWTNASPAVYALSARAMDDRGLVTTSAPVSITVGASFFNDYFTNRIFLGGSSNYATGNNSDYSKETGEPAHAARSGTHSAWFSYSPPRSAICTIDTSGSTFDTVLAVYTNNPANLETVTNLVVVIYNDDDNGSVVWSRVKFSAVKGIAYQIAVDGFGPASVGNIALQLSLSNTVPVITGQPLSVQVNEGATAAFSVTASGAGSLTYAWRLNGTNLSGGNSSTFTRTNAQLSHGGFYNVVVSNSGGSVTSTPAVLVVRQAPSFVVSPQMQVVDPGANATFTASAVGSAPVAFQWSRNGVLIAGATATSYTSGNIQYTDGGTYRITADNAAGNTSAAAELFVRPLVTGIGTTTNGMVQFSYYGTPGKTYALDRTAALVSTGSLWTAVMTFSNTTISALLSDTNNLSATQRFYRIRLMP